MFALLSTVTLLGMYFLVFFVVGVFLLFSGLSGLFSLTVSFVLTIFIVLIQFFVSPFVYDIMLKWMYKCNFINVDELPPGIANFVKKVFSERGVKLPRIGIIDDYTPTAFTYGNFPSNARVVISKGLLEIMDEEEVKAVLAHEFGHIFHYDFIFMTLASMVPIILYYIYRFSYELANSRNSRRSGGGLILLAIITYIFYLISEYIVLYLSRLREYYADKFSAYLTMNPNSLATALVKVGYGLLNLKAESRENNTQFYRSPFRVLGLMDIKQARSISLSAINAGALASEVIEVTAENIVSKTIDSIAKVMAWDLFNPWASFLELSSTHPLIAKRIRNLSQISKELGLPFSIEIPKTLPREDNSELDLNPNSLWDEFFIDLFFQYAPLLGGLVGLFVGIFFILSKPGLFLALFFFGVSAGSLIKWMFCYRGNFTHYRVFDLLSKTKVSMIRAIPSILQGRIVGRGVSGYILSEDVLFQDETGFIYVDYKTGFTFGDLAYGFFITKGLIGKKAKIKGYFRRAIFPYFEVIEIETEDGKKYRSYYRYLWLVGIFIMFILGLLVLPLGIV